MKVQRFSLSTVDSTNLWAKENWKSFDREALVVIVADEQTDGQGQRGKRWLSPHGGLYVTFCFFSKKRHPKISLVLALAACKVLETLGFQPRLKPPNDILINAKKVAGLLGESVSLDDAFLYILGIGINVSLADEELKLIDQPATSLNGIISPKELLDLLEQQFLNDLFIE